VFSGLGVYRLYTPQPDYAALSGSGVVGAGVSLESDAGKKTAPWGRGSHRNDSSTRSSFTRFPELIKLVREFSRGIFVNFLVSGTGDR